MQSEDTLEYPWDKVSVRPGPDGKITLTARQYQELRKLIQRCETIIDGATQQKKINHRRLSLALSTIRSIQTRYFPQMNYSLHYFKGENKAGEQTPDRKNYQKYKREKQKANHPKITEHIRKPEDHEDG